MSVRNIYANAQFRHAITPSYKQMEETLIACHSPLTSFKLVKLIANNNFLEMLASSIWQKLGENRMLFLADPNTECIKTMFALSIIFSGEQRAKKVVDCFKNPIPKFKNFKEMFGYKASLLFDGLIIRMINREPEFEDLSHTEKINKLNDLLSIQYASYSTYLEGYMGRLAERDNGFKEAHPFEILINLDFQFNKTILVDLETTLLENSLKLTSEVSFIYYVGIETPNGDAYTWIHAFALEQFKNENSSSYRIYQSWASKITLLEDLNKRGYDENGKGAMNESELQEFLSNLKKYCCTKDRKTVSTFPCFGFFSFEFPLLEFRKGVLTGIGLRWWVDSFNPQDCQKNFLDYCSHFTFLGIT